MIFSANSCLNLSELNTVLSSSYFEQLTTFEKFLNPIRLQKRLIVDGATLQASAAVFNEKPLILLMFFH